MSEHDEPSGRTRYFEYDVFISYRSSMFPDKPVAETLQRVLETFPVPGAWKNNIASPGRWRSRLKVFRDITDLNASSDLNEALKQKLRFSRFLIVVCTPNLPSSPYCTEEVRFFREYHGDQAVLHLLVQGEPNESFPRTSPFLQGSDENSTIASNPAVDSLAADIRADSSDEILRKLEGKGVPKARQAKYKLLAPVLGCKSPDELIQRDKARFRRQIAVYSSVLLLLILGFSTAIYTQGHLGRIRTDASKYMASLSDTELPKVADYETLGRLADGEAAVHSAFVEQLLSQPTNAERLHPKLPYLLHALVGLDAQKKRRVKIVLSKYGRVPSNSKAINIAVAELGVSLAGDDVDFDKMVTMNILTALRKTNEATLLASLGRATSSMSKIVPSEQATLLAQQIVAAMMRSSDRDDAVSDLGHALGSLGEYVSGEQALAGAHQIVVAMDTVEQDSLRSLTPVLIALIERLSEEQALTLAEQILDSIEKEGDYSSHIPYFGRGLGALVEKLPEEEALAGAQRIVNVMEKTKGSNFIESLGEALGNFVEKFQRKQATILAQQIVAAMEKTTEEWSLRSLGYALASLGEKLPEEQASAGAHQILAAMEKTTNASVIGLLRGALVSMSKKLPEEQASIVSQLIVSEMQVTNDAGRLRFLIDHLESMSEKLPEEQASVAARQILATVKRTPETHLMFDLSAAYSWLGEKLSEEQALVLAQRVSESIEQTNAPPGLVASLGRMLGGIGKKIPREQAPDLASQIVATMGRTVDNGTLIEFSVALGSLGEKLPEEQALAGARQIVAAMKDTAEPVHLKRLGDSLGSLVTQLSEEQTSDLARRIVTAMKETPHSWFLCELGEGLGKFGEKLSEEQASAAARQILAAMATDKNKDYVFLLGIALDSLGKKISGRQALAGAELMVAAAPDEKSGWMLGLAFDDLLENLSDEQAEILAQRIVSAMQRTTDQTTLTRLADLLGTLAERMKAEHTCSVLKSIVCVGDIRKKVLEGLAKRAGQEFDSNLWKAVDWLIKKKIDVREVPRFPMVSTQ